MRRRPVVVLAVALALGFSLRGEAQLPWPAAIPPDMSEDLKRDLANEASVLDRQRAVLATQVAAHNQRCGQVPESSALEADCRASRGALQREVGAYAAAVQRFNERVDILQEQSSLERAPAHWYARQEERIRQAVDRDRKWTEEVRASLLAGRVPDPTHRPQRLGDLQPGNIILVAPAAGGGWIKATDNWITGLRTPASHALTFLGRSGNRMLFLDHQLGEGTRIIGDTEFHRRYAARGLHVAAVAKVIDKAAGRELLRLALELAEKERIRKGLGTGFGVLGKDLVCSEVAALAIGRAMGIDFRQEVPRNLRRAIAHVDITPGDFYDEEHLGKHFVISPLAPR